MNPNKLIKHNGIELTLEQWLRNEMMVCFAGWPEEVREIATVSKNHIDKIWYVLNDTSVEWESLKADKTFGGPYVYRLNPDYKFEEPKKSGWVEFDIDDYGCFHIEQDLFGEWYNWQHVLDSCKELTHFGGWLFNHPQSNAKIWSQQLFGICSNPGDRLEDCDVWDSPQTPTKIRFWRQYE